MNILMAVTNLSYANGGVSTHVIDLCRAFTRKGHQVVLLSDGTDYPNEISAINGVEYIELPFLKITKSPNTFIKCFYQIKKLCKEYKIDVFHVHGQRIIPIAQLIKRTCRIPYVWSNHTDNIPQLKLQKLLHKLWKFPIISVSQDIADFIVSKGFDEDSITVINNPIDCEKFSPLSAEERAKYKRKYLIQEDEYVICILSRINDNKGQGRLIRAMHKVMQLHPGQKFKLLVSGTGDMEYLEKEVMQYARENNIDCLYCGFADQRSIFGVSDLFVLPSLWEGFALVCVESVCAGCPTIRSETPGWRAMQEFVPHYEKNDNGSLVSLIDYAFLHQDEMHQLVEKAKPIIEKEFSFNGQCQKIEDVYTNIMEE